MTGGSGVSPLQDIQKATFHSLFSHAPDYLIPCEYCECPSRSDGPPGYSCPYAARKISGTVPVVPLTPMVGKGALLPLRPVLRVFQPPLYDCFRCWEFRSLGGYVLSRRLLSGPATQGDAASRRVGVAELEAPPPLMGTIVKGQSRAILPIRFPRCRAYSAH